MMNSVCVKIFDINRSKTGTCRFLDMCLTPGGGGVTAAYIFSSIEEKFDKYSIPWENCVYLYVDNTNTMVGKKNSVVSRFLHKNDRIFISGCPCHLVHIAANNANDAFREYIGINVEDVLVDLFYWFDKSAKRNGKLSYVIKSTWEF